MSTYTPKAGDISQKWYVIDASDVVLGRLASQAAQLLRGKHKPTFTPNVDTGDFVIIINAEKIALSGSKLTDKYHYHHSGFPGGMKATPVGKVMNDDPAKVVEKAVLGMIPRNRLGRAIAKKLKVYAGAEHPHKAQNPEVFEIKQVSQ